MAKNDTVETSQTRIWCFTLTLSADVTCPGGFKPRETTRLHGMAASEFRPNDSAINALNRTPTPSQIVVRMCLVSIARAFIKIFRGLKYNYLFSRVLIFYTVRMCRRK